MIYIKIEKIHQLRSQVEVSFTLLLNSAVNSACVYPFSTNVDTKQLLPFGYYFRREKEVEHDPENY